ncbi:MAG: T9SS type A sorting domain-containing protein [Clostridia bacterium]|nr:T9SS type A sorting domain-containing protein [Clostridia bacterium]
MRIVTISAMWFPKVTLFLQKFKQRIILELNYLNNMTMIKRITSLLMALVLIAGVAFSQDQPAIHDAISMEPGRTHDVYYSLNSGTSTQVQRDVWDIAFSTRTMDVTILTNGASGVQLYTYPNSGTDGWESIDTTGMYLWPLMYNDDTDWENGAFNRNGTGSELDYGWGVYNTITHIISGDSLFVMQMPDGKIKKMWIMKKNPITNEYTFKYASLDGTDEQEMAIALNDYNTKNFIGYSIANNAIVDFQPATNDWDLLFAKYITFYGGVMWYPVTGIKQNYNVQAAAYAMADTSMIDYNTQDFDSANITTIGNNWYTLQGGMPPTYAIKDSLVYFVSDRESSIWKVVFEDYQSSQGIIGFRKQLLENHAGIASPQIATSGYMAVQPNPASATSVEVMFDADDNGLAQLRIFSITGAKSIDQTVTYSRGLNRHQIDISRLPAGAYVITLTVGATTLRNKLIVQ